MQMSVLIFPKLSFSENENFAQVNRCSDEGYQCAPRVFLSLKVINKLRTTKDVVPSLQEGSIRLFKSAKKYLSYTNVLINLFGDSMNSHMATFCKFTFNAQTWLLSFVKRELVLYD